MYNKFKQVEPLMFKSIYVLFVFMMLVQMLNVHSLTSLFLYPTLLLTVGLWGIQLSKSIDKTDIIIMLIIVISFVNVLINGILNEAVISISYIKKTLLFDIVCIYLQVMNRKRCNLEDKLYIYFTFDSISFLFLVAYFLQGRFKYFINGKISNYLSFLFSNPNLVAMILLGLFIFQTINLLKETNKNQRIYRGIMSFLLFLFIMETKARNTQLVMIGYLIVYSVINFTDIKFKFDKWLSLGVAIFPLIFFSIYMLVIDSPIIKGLFGFMEDVGKGLNSRLKIWVPGFEGFIQSPIIGNYYGISNGTGASHLHNSHLDIMASFGIIVLILVCIYLYLLVWQKGRRYSSRENQSYMLGFCSMLLLGMGETGLFSGALATFVLMSSFLVLSHEGFR